jgi:lipopolysaccharide transport system ATP-binding protein
MPKNAIVVENLSKSYQIGHRTAQHKRYTALRDVVIRETHNFTRKAIDFVHGRKIVQGDEVEEFWALRNVSFEVKQGQVLGIIGRNGAGKSTLLKILSRITEPTTGRITLRGRVVSLLEVGTGFHPELTGRENIFLNGAILGMTQREIRKKLDEIVAFAEVEKFLDTPVKHYSSGMYVRLAFAVAAHLESDIMVVDEVLAVGDHEFQQKCLDKMDNISIHEGRTVLLVSHDLAAIAELTKRALLIEGGRIAADGTAVNVISRYTAKHGDGVYVRPAGPKPRKPFIARIEVCTSSQKAVHRFGEPLEIKIWIQHDAPIDKACLSLNVCDQRQRQVFAAHAHYPYFRFGRSRNQSLLICKFPSPRLYIGNYSLRLFLSEPPGGELYERLDGVCAFEVIRTDRETLYTMGPADCAYFEDYHWEAHESDRL